MYVSTLLRVHFLLDKAVNKCGTYNIQAVFAEACTDADLVVIEGMGRALHSNLYAQLNCDTLKIANIKSEMVCIAAYLCKVTKQQHANTIFI